ncbi:MAG: hypothetical protein II243_05930 [Lachnospiraceae bacterium]|nr:hypothetical protein [Lachnospiraceae bacterium]
MAAIFFLIFVILLLRNPEDRRKSDLNKYLVIGSIFLGFIGSIINNGSIAGLAIFAIITYLISLLLKKNKYEKKSKEYGFYETKFKEDQPGYNASYQRTTQQGSAWQTSTQQAAQQSSSDKFNSRGQGPGRPNFTGDAVYGATSLPSSAVKRRKIVAKFNEKYELCLTDAQIQSIVNSSYMSQTWRREVEAMDRKYESMYEWFQGPTGWLRVYLYVFKVQDISSDIQLQENIVAHSFDEIFNYADECETFTIHDTIERINNHFMTTFDDATFAAAYRFLEMKGRRHVIKTHRVVRNEDTIDELESKYTKMGQ